MPIIDPRGFNLVPDVGGFADSIGAAINQSLSERLAQKAMTGDKEAMAELAVRNPAASGRIGGIMQDQQTQELEKRKTYQDMAYRVARGYKTAKDKAGYLSAAAQQLRAAGLEDMAVEIEDDAAVYASNPGQVDQEYDSINEMFSPVGGQDAATRHLQFLTQGMTPEEAAEARRVAAGVAPRAGSMSATERVATTPGMAETVATSEATIEGAKSGAKEGAKLGQQAERLPSIQGAVTAAKEAAKSGAKETGKAKSNATALSVYETGITNLKSALGDTTTGPMVGWMPAFTANQQKAEGAVAAMAPILKEIFRSAGEGTFTEGDQKLLTDMIPGRGTLPEAAAAQLQAIDQIVRAKLGGGAKPAAAEVIEVDF